jgi:hypothetical protein
MKAVMQLIETLLKSDAYLTILGMIFPSGVIHEGARNFNPLFESERINELDYQSLNHLSIFGTYVQGRTIPTYSVPGFNPPQETTINKIFFCDIYNSQAGISNMLWDSGAPFIIKLFFEDQGPLGSEGIFMSQPGIMELIERKYRCVYTLNNDNRVICPLDDYIKAYADYIRVQYNMIAAPYEQPREIRQTRRNVFNMVTSGIRFN